MGNTSAAAKLDESSNEQVIGLRVLIARDGNHWFAQGLDIDYSASGKSVTEVQERFAEGLCWSLAENLRVFGHTKNFVKVAPQEEWNRFLQRGAKEFSLTIRGIDLPDQQADDLPFDSIHFLVPKSGAPREAARR
jgi:hypothetical protein